MPSLTRQPHNSRWNDKTRASNLMFRRFIRIYLSGFASQLLAWRRSEDCFFFLLSSYQVWWMTTFDINKPCKYLCQVKSEIFPLEDFSFGKISSVDSHRTEIFEKLNPADGAEPKRKRSPRLTEAEIINDRWLKIESRLGNWNRKQKVLLQKQRNLIWVEATRARPTKTPLGDYSWF